MNYLKTFIENQKTQKRQHMESEISSTFNVAVKENKLWITHNHDGIKEIENSMTAEEIVAELNKFKNTAIKYK